MSTPELLKIWPTQPALSLLIWLFISVVLMYLARTPAHQFITSFCRLISRSLKMASKSLMLAEARLCKRNREVIIAEGREACERSIEREFHRIDSTIKKDLSTYPVLNRTLSDLAKKIDDDYSKCGEVPPEPSDWVKAVEAVAKIKTAGDTQTAKMLGDIKVSINDHHSEAMEEYRKSSTERHNVLSKIAPYWRDLTGKLDKVSGSIKGIQERSAVIDKKLRDFDRLTAKADETARTLAVSSATQFVISGLVLLVAIGGAAINFNLIALPMSEMVGGGSYIGPYKTSSIAAMVIIMVEVAMGLYLMEALRITSLFPVIGSMNDRMRVRMLWITFSILFILAGVEASLAYMRDVIALDTQALRQSLAQVESVQGTTSWIPTVGQMVMGFILPFALTFVAIPLESFIHSSR
ncbi:MAG: hypothetical protein ACE5DR_01530, partial [Thermodesulfobacteriota bacterium]